MRHGYAAATRAHGVGWGMGTVDVEWTLMVDGSRTLDVEGVRLDSAEILPSVLAASRDPGTAELRIRGAVLEGNAAWRRLVLKPPLVFDACEFLDELDLSHAELGAVVFERCTFRSCGLRLVNASISEDLVVSGGAAEWLDASRTRVAGDIRLTDLTIGSGVRPGRTSDRPALDLSKIQVEDLQFSGVTVGGRLALFEAEASEIHIGQGVIGADRTNMHPDEQPESVSLATSAPTRYATLWMSQIQVRNGVRLGPGLTVNGDIRFVDSVIGRSLRMGVDTDWGKRHSEGTRGTVAVTIDGGYLNLLRASVGNRTEIRVRRPGSSPSTPHMIFNDAWLADITIHEPCIGPGSGLVSLDGARYSYLGIESPQYLPPCHEVAGIPAELALVRAFASAPDPKPTEGTATTLYRAQPYRQLSRSWASAGKQGHAKNALIWMHRDARLLGGGSWLARAWAWVADVTVRFGYSIHRAAVPLVLAVLLAFAVVMLGKGSDQFVAVEPGTAVDNVAIAGVPADVRADLVRTATSSSACTAYYPCMQPLVYTLDVLVPITDFRQASYWQPKGDWQGRSWLVVLTVTAWLATTVLLSGVASVARRDHESSDDQ